MENELDLFIYNTFINYSKGIGKDLDNNEDIYVDLINNFNYKIYDPLIKIDKDSEINIKDEFFKKISCKYYCKKNNKNIKDFIKYIDELENNKDKKFTNSYKDKVLLQEKLYNLYVDYLKDNIKEKDLLKEYNKLKINKDCKCTSNLINYLEHEAYQYTKNVLGTSELLDYLNNYGPLKTKLKKEGKISIYTDEELKLIKKLYQNYINYYDMNITYDEYLLKENKLLNKINNNRKSFAYRKKAKELINYYMKDIINTKYNINNSNLYKKCFNLMEDYYNNNLNDNVEDLINKYRLNIYNYAYLYARENDLLDEFNNFKNNKSNIRTINYKDLVNQFIKLGIYSVNDYLLEYNIDKDEFKKYIRYLKNNDNNLYVKYQASLIKNEDKTIKYINNRIKGLDKLINKGIPSNKLQINREFKLLDYYLYCDKFLYEYDRVYKLSKKILNDINDKYYDIIRLLDEVVIKSEEELLLEEYIYQGLVIDMDDKKNIINYLNKYNIPLSSHIFNDCIDRYMNNNLYDLSLEILEIKELNYKKIKFYSSKKIDDLEII